MAAKMVQSFADSYRLKARISVDDGFKSISGKYGQIYEYADAVLGVMVMPDPPRKRYWGCIRARLLKAGFSVVLDCEGEGAAIFDPENQKQASLAILAAGVKRRRRLSPEQREQRIAFLRAAQERHLAPQERPNAQG